MNHVERMGEWAKQNPDRVLGWAAMTWEGPPDLRGHQTSMHMTPLVSVEWVLQLEAELAALRTKQPAASEGDVIAWVGDMKTSAGMGYYVCVGRPGGKFGDGYLTPQMYRIRGRAEYDVAKWNHLLHGGPDPDLLAFDTDEPALDNTSKQAAGEAVDEASDRAAFIAWLEADGRLDMMQANYAWRGWRANSKQTTPPRHPADEGMADALCIHCGRPTMHIGNVCFTCSKAAKNTALQAGTPT